MDVNVAASGVNLTVLPVADPGEGSQPYRNIDVDESEDQIASTECTVWWLHCMNLSASVVYLQMYNALAASVTVGTTTADLTFPVPTQGDTNGAGFAIAFGTAGAGFDTALTIAATTTPTGSGGPGSNEVFVNLGYGD